MKFGTIPPKDALWQSYQPPVFYVLSAVAGSVALELGMPIALLPKLLQLAPCIYGILTLVVIGRILRRLPLDDSARVMAFGAVCFLPQHIYASAMHSNDTCAVLAVAVCTDRMLSTLDGGFSFRDIAVTSVAIVIAMFTKYTALVVLPMAAAILAAPITRATIASRARRAIAALMLLAVPLAVFAAYALANFHRYGKPLPINDTMLDPGKTQPHPAGGLSFVTFKPWETIRMPILAPGTIDSFWTLLYSRMWFDMEPKFLYLADGNTSGWARYYEWLRGEKGFPSPAPLTPQARRLGGALIASGLIPLAVVLAGATLVVLGKSRRPGIVLFPVQLALNFALVVALTVRFPVFSAMKASYLLPSLPAFAVFLAVGADAAGHHPRLGRLVIGGLVVAFVLAVVHVLAIGVACGTRPALA